MNNMAVQMYPCTRCHASPTLTPLLYVFRKLTHSPSNALPSCNIIIQADNPERANSCTSAFYEGQAAIMDPRESWAAKWIRVDNCLPGVYAIAITGQFDRDIEEDLENRGIRWRCKPPGSTTE